MRPAIALILLTLTVKSGNAQTYFPPGVLADTPDASDAAANRYSNSLRSMHEPSLFELAQRDPGAEAYRLLWLRDFDHPAVIRFVRKPSGSGWFYRRMTPGTGAGQPGRNTEYGMSWSWKSRTASFLKTIEDAGFWNLPTLENTVGNSIPVCRSHWILEGIRNGQYHVVDRCSPDETDPVRAVGMRAMKLANLRVHKGKVY
jgi:hypothetical protein